MFGRAGRLGPPRNRLKDYKMFPVSNKNALGLLKWATFFSYFSLLSSVLMLLYKSKGISIGDFFMLDGIFRIVGFALGIPAGYLSDIFSRKKVLLFGMLAWTFGYAALFFAYGFWQLMIPEILMGIGVVLYHYTLGAYLYDLLKRDGREKEFLKENSHINAFAILGAVIASIISGYVYAEIGNWATLITAAVQLVGTILVLLLPELNEFRRKISKKSTPWKDVKSVVKMSVKHPELKWFMLFPAIITTFAVFVYWILQPTMETIGVSVALFGIFIGIHRLAQVVFSKYAERIFKTVGLKNTLYICIATMAASVAAPICALLIGTGNMWIVYILCAVAATFSASFKLCELVFDMLIHDRVKSTERGTVQSLSRMYVMLIGAGAMILMKPLLDGIGMEWTIVVALAMLAVILYPLRKILAIKEI